MRKYICILLALILICIDYTIAESDTLLLLNPNGGEVLIGGDIYTIGWSSGSAAAASSLSTSYISNIVIEYSTNNGSSWNNIATVPDTGSYDWPVPAVYSNQSLIRISDADNLNISDTSDSVFTIRNNVIYVDVNAEGNNDGSSWTNAYRYLQDALAEADSADKPVEIRAAKGTYKPDQGGTTTAGDRAATFGLDNGITLRGGYAGNGEVNPDARDIDAHKTILTGDLYGNDYGFSNNNENSYHVVTAGGTGEPGTIDGFVITGGNANIGTSTSKTACGGGMFIDSGSHIVTNCIFTKNMATYFGGGVHINSGSPQIIHCQMFSNVVVNTPGSTAGRGGGISMGYGEAVIDDCIITGNQVNAYGGGVYCDNSNGIVRYCKITGNTAWFGGGLSSFFGNGLNVSNCLISDNTASDGGGGIILGHSSATIINCTITRNTAQTRGGSVYINYSDPKIRNSILWGSTAPTGPEIYILGGGNPIVTYCDIKGGWTGQGNINADPHLTAPANPDPNMRDYHLLPDSPCIDAGDPASDFGLEPEPDGGRINMGVYGNTPEATCKGGLVLQSYNLMSRTRVGRASFDYVYTMTLNNNSINDVYNVVVELLDAPSNVTVNDANVSFDFIGAGLAEESGDSFSIRVDRSIPIDVTVISWRATYESAERGTEQISFSTMIALEPVLGDLIVNGVIDLEDLAEVAGQWLWEGEPWAIEEDLNGDGSVNLKDVSILGENWME